MLDEKSSQPVCFEKKVILRSNLDTVTITVFEYFSEQETIFTWPSALLLAAFLWSRRAMCEGNTFLELGAGNGLPSMVAAAAGMLTMLALAVPSADKSALPTYSMGCQVQPSV